MTRTRASAKAAGSTFERQIANFLRDTLENPAIDRKVRTGAKDCGDIANVSIDGHEITLECKNCATTSLSQWVKEAKQESINAGSLCGLVVHKRRGTTKPEEQWVTCTVAELVALIKKVPPQ